MSDPKPDQDGAMQDAPRAMQDAPRAMQDGALRAMTDDGAFRVVTVRTTDTVQRMLEVQAIEGAQAQRLGELVTSAVLVRETMAPDYRLQALLRSADGRMRMVADSHPDGGSRGLVAKASADQADSSLDNGTLEVVRTLFNGELHRGVVSLPPSGAMSEAVMSYLQSSEQVASMLSVACVLDAGRVVAAGGYLVQLLPEVGRAPLAIMAERLTDFRDIGPLLARTDAALAPLLDELLYGMPFTRLTEHALSWKCRCSTVRVMSSLSTLSKKDLAELIEGEQNIELSCDFCGHTYNVSPVQLAGLMEQS